MKKKIAALAFAGASLGLFATAPGAGAAHYCVTDGQGEVRQTNGNGNRGSDGWRNASGGQERAPGTFECDGETTPPPGRVNGR